MTRGAILFAFNSPEHNYYSMAEYTAKRINHFLNMPVTVVTDENSVNTKSSYNFDRTVIVTPDTSNKRQGEIWINKGRYQAYEFSPYDETVLLDVDYVVNSDRVSRIFDTMDDFCCHGGTGIYMKPGNNQEALSPISYNTLWATVVGFKKTQRAKSVFETIKLIQDNYNHYSNLHGFLPVPFRNDFALTVALRIVNGHTTLPGDIIPWNLLHVGKATKVYPLTNDEFNTKYLLMFDKWQKSKIKKEYIEIKDSDFHVINKEVFVELMNS